MKGHTIPKQFVRVLWATMCPYCMEASGAQPTNAGYLTCPACGEVSYNEDDNTFKGK